jgi:peptidoglycan/xylan/chitin deacetylase (PgdA/CDA1 family)
MKHITLLFLIILLFSSACTPVAQVAQAPETEASTGTPTFIPTLTFTSTALPVATLTPTFTPTLIPTLMLHRPSLQFDSLAFLKEFIKILKQENMRAITYQDISKNPDITATEQGKLFIITIDDISLAYPMNRHMLEMIELLRETGYPAVLGVVTETDYPYAETVTLLKELSDSGWEVASHTDHHANLGKLEKASATLVYQEVSTSLDKIEKTIGVRPITLVLPEGQMVDYMENLDHLDLSWVVGINGGVTYDSQDEIIYVGREGPSKNAEYTYKIMKMRFGFG